MELRHRIGTYAKTSLAVTSQVIQSIRILQYSRDELEEFLLDQAERNPLIELHGVGDGIAAAAADPAGPRDGPAPGAVAPATRQAERPAVADRTPAGSGSAREAATRYGPEHFCAAPITLSQHLRQQAAVTFRDPAEAIMAVGLIESLDGDGYLRGNLAEIARRLGADEVRLDSVLRVVQGFDPAGVGARNLAECLAIQLRELDRLDPAMQAMLDNLGLLAAFEHRQLARICGVDLEDIAAMAQEIRRLDPRPGRRFDSSPVQPALPDVFVVSDGAGGYRVELNTSILPRVLVNRQYYAELRANRLGAHDMSFVVDCMKNANWLARNVDQRARTILKVATEVVAQQAAFLEKGVEHLRPLNLRDVAEVVGVHESTVCRAISNKYMMTARGLLELRYFFMNSIAAADGGNDLSSETVRHRIAALVRSETADQVYSDEAIVAVLREGGIDIARRTVAKYREILHIPASSQRRRQKQLLQMA